MSVTGEAHDGVPLSHRRSVLLLSVVFVVAILQLISSSGIVQRLEGHDGVGDVRRAYTLSSRLHPIVLPGQRRNRKFGNGDYHSAFEDRFGGSFKLATSPRIAPLRPLYPSSPVAATELPASARRSSDGSLDGGGSSAPPSASSADGRTLRLAEQVGVRLAAHASAPALPPASSTLWLAPSQLSITSQLLAPLTLFQRQHVPDAAPVPGMAQLQAVDHRRQYGAGMEQHAPVPVGYLTRAPDGRQVYKLPTLNTIQANSIVHSATAWLPHPMATLPLVPDCACPAPAPPANAAADAFAVRVHLYARVAEIGLPQRLFAPRAAVDPKLLGVFDEAFVINVPDRDDRTHYICSVLRALGVPAVLWPAFDRRHSRIREYLNAQRFAWLDERLNYSRVDANGRARVPRMSLGEIACWASHREVWHEIVARQLGATLVLEDDVDMEEDLAAVVAAVAADLPPDWAVWYLGHCYEDLPKLGQHQKVGHRLYRAIRPGCTHAYVIRNHTVAARLIDAIGHDLCMPLDLGFIGIIGSRSAQFPIYVTLPPPITQIPRTGRSKLTGARLVGHNPSDVARADFALPLQPLRKPVRHALLAAAADAKAHGRPDPLCGSILFEIQGEESSILRNYTVAEYLSV